MKALTLKEVKKELLKSPDTEQHYLQEKRIDELQELLQSVRKRAGLTVSQVAERMGISQPAVSKLEKNASRASVFTLQRYANACGCELRIGVH